MHKSDFVSHIAGLGKEKKSAIKGFRENGLGQRGNGLKLQKILEWKCKKSASEKGKNF